MARNDRVRILYQKYIDRSCNDAELEELFDLLKDNKEMTSVREILYAMWNKEESVEEFYSLEWSEFISRMPHNEPKVTNARRINRTLITRISAAASLLLILGLTGWFWLHREVITLYETGYGDVREIVLNDNSHVRLNANSKLYWDSNWERRESRKVRLEGEAFFNVAHRDGDRFLVATPDLTITVTGTAFNVVNRRHETEVYLESGAVHLRLKDNHGQVENAINEDTMTTNSLAMAPGEQLSYSSVTERLQQKINVTTKQAASWKTGELIFTNVPLSEVLLELSDVYGKSFIVQDTILFDKKIDVGMPYSDWETVKGLLELMVNAEIMESNNKVTIKK